MEVVLLLLVFLQDELEDLDHGSAEPEQLLAHHKVHNQVVHCAVDHPLARVLVSGYLFQFILSEHSALIP